MTSTKFRAIKPEIRVVGIDDGAFNHQAESEVLVVGAVFRGGYWLDGVMHTRVEVDGFDATEKIGKMITRSPHHKQLRIIMLDGVTFAGFNVVDIDRLSIETGLPVIAITSQKPDFDEIHDALTRLPKGEERWKIINKAGKMFEVHARNKKEKAFMQISGIQEDDAKKILHLTSTRSSLPEALRVAHLIASGVSRA